VIREVIATNATRTNRGGKYPGNTCVLRDYRKEPKGATDKRMQAETLKG